MPLSKNNVRRTNQGFSLLELLVVIAIIGIILAIFLPIMARVREAARCAACKSNLKQIHAVLLLYATGDGGNDSLPIGPLLHPDQRIG